MLSFFGKKKLKLQSSTIPTTKATSPSTKSTTLRTTFPTTTTTTETSVTDAANFDIGDILFNNIIVKESSKVVKGLLDILG